jgi:hypothetical protein
MYGLNGIRKEGNGFTGIFNIESDPREENSVFGTNAWVIGPYLKSDRRVYEDTRKVPESETRESDPVQQVDIGAERLKAI